MGAESSKQQKMASNEDFTAPLTPDANRCLVQGRRLALERNCLFAGTEHLLFSLLRDSAAAPSAVVKFLSGVPKSKEDQASLIGKLRDSAAAMIEVSAGSAAAAAQQQVANRYSPSLSRALELSHFFAAKATSNKISELLLLLGLLSVGKVDGTATAAGKLVSEWAMLKAVSCSLDDLLLQLVDTTLKDSAPLGMALVAQAPDGEAAKGEAVQFPPRKTHIFKLFWSESIVVGTDPQHQQQQQSQFYSPPPNQRFKSPVPDTHYIFPEALLCGPSPGRMHNMKRHLKTMIEQCGVNCFVSLQSSYTEYGCADYRAVIGQMVREKQITRCRGGSIRFLNSPIPDFGVTDDSSLLALIQELQKIMFGKQQKEGDAEEDGGTLLHGYLHCFGGHGRTGTVAVNLISAVEGVNFPRAMRLLQERHRFRVECGGYCALSSGELEDERQEQQTHRMAPHMRRQQHIS